jgi:type IV pilus assembly protein PilQ
MIMNFKNNCFFFLYSFFVLIAGAQDNRIQQLHHQLESIIIDAPGLNNKAEINVNNVSLADFLQSLALSHQLNMDIEPELSQISISNNFSNVSILDILVFLCKEHKLAIDFNGTILSIYRYQLPFIKKIIPLSYDRLKDLISFELQQDTLQTVFKLLTDLTGKNMVFTPGMENRQLNAYIKEMPFDNALDKLAFSNNLRVQKTRDNFYVFEPLDQNLQSQSSNTKGQSAPIRRRSGSFYFEIQDSIKQSLKVDFENAPIENVIYEIGHTLEKNMFTATSLQEAGYATAKAENITYDLLLDKILENTDFTYKVSDSIYYFGKKDQTSLRDAVIIPLMHRSIEVMNSSNNFGRKAGRIEYANYGSMYGSNTTSGYYNTTNQNPNRQPINTTRTESFTPTDSKIESLLSMLPQDVLKDLTVSVDIELNSFIVSGPSQHIERFKKFVEYIDKPVPVLLIEVMLLEINKSATVETGISWGLGTEPANTQGNLFPTTDFTLGANTVNRIIGNFNGFSSLNVGQVVPEFFAQIKAMETNGDIKIRSAPRLSALNGHRANLSIGETTYYAVTQRDIIGSQNPQTSTITNYYPIDAEFAINIKPLVSGDGQITLEINVIQSSFNGKKVDEDAPPGINSREFNSIIRVKDKDLVVLGGLEEKIKNDSGTGVPVLARIPVIKWLFSKKRREDTKKKLTVLIKPTIIN